MILDDLGEFSRDEKYNWYHSQEFDLPIVKNKKVRFVLDLFDNYADNKQAYVSAIHNVLAATTAVLEAVEGEVFRYYKDSEAYYLEEKHSKAIMEAGDVWNHIIWGTEPLVTFRDSDKTAYVSFECECDWEQEHGLQIVFRNGEVISKVGGYDGHLTNSDAFNRKELENTIYVSPGDL